MSSYGQEKAGRQLTVDLLEKCNRAFISNVEEHRLDLCEAVTNEFIDIMQRANLNVIEEGAAATTIALVVLKHIMKQVEPVLQERENARDRSKLN